MTPAEFLSLLPAKDLWDEVMVENFPGEFTTRLGLSFRHNGKSIFTVHVRPESMTSTGANYLIDTVRQ